jgi:predicted nucleic acid-binding protein
VSASRSPTGTPPILEACRSLGGELVLSEDLKDGEDYDGVRVENPFRDR